MKLHSILLLLAPSLGASASTYTKPLPPKQCPSNQEFLPNVQFGCPASCEQPVPMCRAAIGPRCGCRKGFVIAGSVLPRDPQRCIRPGKCHGCPANQRFLPEVQYGCPKSCDQPVSLCKAAIGPGCGCPKGKVLAGSTRPRNPERCIDEKRCNAQRKCPIGTPLLGSNRKQLVCGEGLASCPESAQCQKPKYAKLGVCCSLPKPLPLPPLPMCTIGNPLVGADGDQLFCGRGPSRVECPKGSSCITDPADRFAVCCADPPSPTPSMCTIGNPLVGADGDQLFCGRGPSRVECPQGSSCIIDPTDRFAVCCADPKPTPSLCPIGNPLVGADGDQLFCGRGPSRVECPKGSSCIIDPTDRFALCCADPKPTPTTCTVSGCNSEICSDETINSICIAPTCQQSCLKFATCTTNRDQRCGWNTDAQEYEKCIAGCDYK